MANKGIHKLTNKNILNKTALCENCGVTKVFIRKRKGRSDVWECYNRKQYGGLKFKIPAKIINYGICPICLRETNLIIDHCHKENKFRGFICIKCNSVLGFAKDNCKTLENAILYLRNFK